MRLVRMIDFVYNSQIAYEVEIGDEYMRFFYDGEVVDEIVSPYSISHVFQIHYVQIADVMRISHPLYPPMTLIRTSSTTFALTEIEFTKGPFLTRNDLIDSTNLSPSTMTSSVTVVNQVDTFTPSIPDTSDVFSIQAVDTDGNDSTITFTVAGTQTVKAVVEGLKAAADAAKAAGTAPWTTITATEDDSVLTLTCNTVGELIDYTASATGGETLTEASVAMSTGTLTCSVDWFLSGHIGCIFSLIHPVTTTSVSKDGAGESTSVYIDKEGGYFSTQGTWTGTIKLQKSDNNTDWYDYKTYTALTSGARNDAYTLKEADGPGWFRISNSDASCKATLSTWSILNEGIVMINGVTNTKVATIKVLKRIEAATATVKWAEGAWSDVSGWPSSISFFENRCCYCGDTGRVEL